MLFIAIYVIITHTETGILLHMFRGIIYLTGGIEMGRYFLGRLTAIPLAFRERSGMELVQVAIMVAIAVALGLIFRTQITDFVNRVFEGLNDF